MKKRGFTMVELMIVIAIIAVLASIIMPKMGGSRNKAKLAACKTNLRHIMIAMEMYAHNNNGAYTPCITGTVTYYSTSYLVSGGYLKAIPTCSAGHTYYITANHSAWYHAPAGSTFVYNSGETTHPGLPSQCPYYWVGGSVMEN